MIVTYQETGFDVVLQRHHARLAAFLMQHLVWIEKDYRKVDLILAANNHDDDYNEFGRTDLLNPLGGPRNYTMETFRRADCSRLMDEAVAHSTFMAIMVSTHIQFVYQGTSTCADKFCKELQKLQLSWCEMLGIDKEQIQRYYAILQWCDALSLLICQHLIPPEGRRLEISIGPDNTSYYISACGEEMYTITPWPFTTDSLTCTIERRVVHQLIFKNDKQLQDALKQAPLTLQQITFIKR